MNRNREEVAEGYTKLHNGELHNLYSSPNITGEFTSRSKRWTAHAARMEIKMHRKF
jgi:hypothetical protein